MEPWISRYVSASSLTSDLLTLLQIQVGECVCDLNGQALSALLDPQHGLLLQQ